MAKGLALLAASALCAACAALDSAPGPELERSELAVTAADTAGAAAFAPAELARAREKLSLARRWMAARDYKPALWLIEQARVDAELAGAKALSARSMRER